MDKVKDSVLEPCPLKVGDRVSVIADALPSEWREDWRNVEAYVAGIDYSRNMPGGYDITITEVWPPNGGGDLTDGFGVDQLACLSTLPLPVEDEVQRVARAIADAVARQSDSGIHPKWSDFRDEARAAIVALQPERARLVEALRKLNAHVERMQASATSYLQGLPRGLDRENFVNIILYLLDGPEQREAQGIARAALNTTGRPA